MAPDALGVEEAGDINDEGDAARMATGSEDDGVAPAPMEDELWTGPSSQSSGVDARVVGPAATVRMVTTRANLTMLLEMTK